MARATLAGVLTAGLVGCSGTPVALPTDDDYGRVSAAEVAATDRPLTRVDAAEAERRLAEAQAAKRRRAAGSPVPAGPSAAEVRAAGVRINLRGGDMPPGFASTSPNTTSSHRRKVAEFATCSGVTPLAKHAGDVASNQFATSTSPGWAAVSSEVQVLPTAAMVAQDLRVWRAGASSTCVQRLVADLVFDGSTTAALLSPKPRRKVRVSAPGTDGSYGHEYPFSMSGPKGPTVLTVTMLGYTKKRTEVSMTVLAAGDGLPMAVRKGLFDVLVERGRRHAL